MDLNQFPRKTRRIIKKFNKDRYTDGLVKRFRRNKEIQQRIKEKSNATNENST